MPQASWRSRYPNHQTSTRCQRRTQTNPPPAVTTVDQRDRRKKRLYRAPGGPSGATKNFRQENNKPTSEKLTTNYKVRKRRDVSRQGGSVAEWLACLTQAQKGPGSNHSRDAVG